MKTTSERIARRLVPNRPMSMISIRVPEDVIEDLKEVAPALGFGGYQALIRYYIGQGLRKDLQELEDSPLSAIVNSLREQGVEDGVISLAIAEAKQKTA